MPDKHPTWDGAVTLEDSELNRRAADLMRHFYLGQGFMEAPEWSDLGDDFRFGFRALAALLIEPGAVHTGMLHGLIAKPTPAQITHLYPAFAKVVEAASELVTDMKDEIEGKYTKTKDHPAMARRYERDLASVKQVEAALRKLDE